MNWIVKWGVKKWVVGIVNTAIEQYGDSVSKARATISRYTAKVESVLAFLKSVDAKLADNKLTTDEADAIIDEAGNLAGTMVA